MRKTEKTVSLLIALCVVLTMSFQFGAAAPVFADVGAYTITSSVTATSGESSSAGTVSLSADTADEGDTVTVTASPGDGYYAAQIRYTTGDGTYTAAEVTSAEAGALTAEFIMPASDVSVSADFTTVVWDGTVDISWYNPDFTTTVSNPYEIYYPAQWAGVAVFVNGIFTSYPVKTDGTPDYDAFMTAMGAAKTGTDWSAESNLYGVFSETVPLCDSYNSYMTSNVTAANTVIGDPSHLQVNTVTADGSGQNVVTSLTTYYGSETFKDQYLKIMNDFDFGGVKNSDGQFLQTSPNYMPVGGDYCVVPENGNTRLSSCFCGHIDGGGHVMKNVYCERFMGTGFGDSQAIGFIGTLGHNTASETSQFGTNTSVRNLAVDGLISGRRMVGGIVGKTGYSIGNTIVEGCMNFAKLTSTDKKGIAGIVGSARNDGIILSCANFGTVYGEFPNAGGLAGDCTIPVINSYQVGYIDALYMSPDDPLCTAIGSNTGGAAFTNLYWLAGSCLNDVACYDPPAGSTITKVSGSANMKNASFLSSLTEGGRDFAFADSGSEIYSFMASKNIYNRIESSITAEGFPVPLGFVGDDAVMESITLTSSPSALSYIKGQTFDVTGIVITGNWSDGTTSRIVEYDVNNQEPLTVSDTAITVSGTSNGIPFSFTFPIEVIDDELTALNITIQPTNRMYASDETFDPSGMTVRATHSNGNAVNLSQYNGTTVTDGYTYNVNYDTGDVTVSYTFGGKTLTASTTVTVLDSPMPLLNEGFYEIADAEQMAWYANQLNALENFTINARLMADIDTTTCAAFIPVQNGTNSGSDGLKGEFDGNGHSVTVDITGAVKSIGLFGNVQGGYIHDLDVYGSVTNTAAVKNTGGIVGNARNARIENCNNYASVTGVSDGTGGILGFADLSTSSTYCVITGCSNYGTITGGNATAGIVGCAKTYRARTNLTITECSNEGSVTGSGYTAGLVGQQTSLASACGNITITSSFNKGAVTGTLNVGGLVGNLGKANSNDTLTGCFNTGAVTSTSGNTAATGAICGSSAGTLNVTNVYYTTGSNANARGTSSVNETFEATALTEDEMKSVSLSGALGSAFTSVPSDYPTFVVQTDMFFNVKSLTGSDTVISTILSGGESQGGDYTFAVQSDWPCAVFTSAAGIAVKSVPTASGAGVYLFTVTEGQEVVVSYIGDADLNGVISISDVGAIITGMKQGMPANAPAALLSDVDGGGTIGLLDADRLLKLIYGAAPSLNW